MKPSKRIEEMQRNHWERIRDSVIEPGVEHDLLLFRVAILEFLDAHAHLFETRPVDTATREDALGPGGFEPACCEAHRDKSKLRTRMITCPKCGNKRCPKAEDCRDRCTGSNELDQVGERESLFGTPPELLPFGATEFESDGMRALRFRNGAYPCEVRINGFDTYQLKCGASSWAHHDNGSLRDGDVDEPAHPWLRSVWAEMREKETPRAKPDCSECKGTGNAIVGNELTSNVVPCHCVSAAAIAGLCTSPFGTPLELIPRDAVEFVSDGFRALRFDDGESLRIVSAGIWQDTRDGLKWSTDMYRQDVADTDAAPWIYYWLPRADEPIERAADRSCSECGAQAILADTEGSEHPLCCECYQPPPPAKDSLTAEAGDALEILKRHASLSSSDAVIRDIVDGVAAWESERAHTEERIERLRKAHSDACGDYNQLKAELEAQLADRDHKIKEAVFNCPRCGRHDFGFFHGPIKEACGPCRKRAEDAENQRDQATARAEKAEARVRELIGERGSEDEP